MTSVDCQSCWNQSLPTLDGTGSLRLSPPGCCQLRKKTQSVNVHVTSVTCHSTQLTASAHFSTYLWCKFMNHDTHISSKVLFIFLFWQSNFLTLAIHRCTSLYVCWYFSLDKLKFFTQIIKTEADQGFKKKNIFLC